MNQTNNTKSYQPLPNIPADIEISQKAEMKPIQDIASKLNLNEEDLEVYGKYKAKLGTSPGKESRTALTAK